MSRSNTAGARNTTRDNIKSNFLDMYRSKPLNQINVSDLAKECNISRGTFYFYFEDIYALYHECEKDLIDSMEKGLSEVILCTVGNDFDKYVEVYAEHLKDYTQHIETYQRLLTGSEEASFRKAWFESIRCQYKKSMIFSKAMPESKRDNMTRFFAGGVLAVLSNWVSDGCKAPAEEIAAISAQALFQGIFLPDK